MTCQDYSSLPTELSPQMAAEGLGRNPRDARLIIQRVAQANPASTGRGYAATTSGAIC